ncbi:MAG: hypothetical protein ACR2K3_09150 [Nocardioides sp.]
MRRIVVRLGSAVAVAPFLAGCGHHAPAARGGLSGQEIARATAIARAEATREDAHVTSATVTAGRGVVVRDNNTGHSCRSGRVLHIKLIGNFPHIVTTGHAVEPGQPMPDFTVHAVGLTADPVTGQTCLIGVQTGHPRPATGAVILDLGQDAR